MLDNPELIDTFLAVQQLHDPPQALFRPRHVAHVATHAVRAYLRQLGEPASA
jgi:hypothetical protein